MDLSDRYGGQASQDPTAILPVLRMTNLSIILSLFRIDSLINTILDLCEILKLVIAYHTNLSLGLFQASVKKGWIYVSVIQTRAIFQLQILIIFALALQCTPDYQWNWVAREPRITDSMVKLSELAENESLTHK